MSAPFRLSEASSAGEMRILHGRRVLGLRLTAAIFSIVLGLTLGKSARRLWRDVLWSLGIPLCACQRCRLIGWVFGRVAILTRALIRILSTNRWNGIRLACTSRMSVAIVRIAPRHVRA
jgi:hypothetical protein